VPNKGHNFSTDGAQVPTDEAECQTKDRKLNTDGAEVQNLGTLHNLAKILLDIFSIEL